MGGYARFAFCQITVCVSRKTYQIAARPPAAAHCAMIRKRDGKMFAAACFAFGLIGPAAAQDMSEFDRFFCDRRDCVGQSRPGKVSVVFSAGSNSQITFECRRDLPERWLIQGLWPMAVSSSSPPVTSPRSGFVSAILWLDGKHLGKSRRLEVSIVATTPRTGSAVLTVKDRADFRRWVADLAAAHGARANVALNDAHDFGGFPADRLSVVLALDATDCAVEFPAYWR